MKPTTYRNYQALIWDWNGTLLNDVNACISAMNCMLGKRSLPAIDCEYYRRIFSFPVQDYYRILGFDFSREDWHSTAMEFINHYRRLIRDCQLQPDAVKVIQHFKNKGKRQFILSAMEQEFLLHTLSERLDINYFEIIAGLDNHYASTKEEIAHGLLEKLNISNRQVLLIGDTIHDFEVALAVGIDCFLVSIGHQSKDRLLATGCTVVDSLSELMRLIA